HTPSSNKKNYCVMAKYIKQEVPDMLKTGNQKVFYRLKTERNIDLDEFVSRMAHPGSGISPLFPINKE
ncbi:MAG: hypothetical protein J6C22_13270, partial [Bacteroides sp.]|nr:hypothetical protein [Bacteroides sp.]